MKVWKIRSHLGGVQLAPTLQSDLPPQPGSPTPLASAASLELPLDFTRVYDRHFDDVLRWIRTFGGPEADLEDLAQEVFVVVRRKLRTFDGGNLPGWLYKIAKLTVRDQGRRAWFRRIFRGPHAVDFDQMPSGLSDPEAALATREDQRLFYRLVGEMSERRRETFLLYEVEGYSGEEIAHAGGASQYRVDPAAPRAQGIRSQSPGADASAGQGRSVMNDRLRDRVGDGDSALARAAELVTSVPEIVTSEARKLRVRNSVLAAGTGRAWLPWLLRPSVVLTLLLAAGTVTAATLGRTLLVRTYREWTGSAKAPATHETREDSSPRSHAAGQAVPPAIVEEKSPLPEVAVPPPAVPAFSRSSNQGTRPSRPPSHPLPAAQPPQELSPAGPAPTKAAPAQETALVMAAVHALRREHDPTRAGLLLDEYLRRYPRGVLAEEVLALAIEAASVRGDTRAAALARTYLERYPQGRFQNAARAAAE